MQTPKPHLDKRPWGEELWMTQEAPSIVKVITVNPGESLSLQYHHMRDEFWHIISGDGTAEIGTAKMTLGPGDNQFIPRETHHRLHGGSTALVLLELSFGKFDENDIVRIEDKYGRVS